MLLGVCFVICFALITYLTIENKQLKMHNKILANIGGNELINQQIKLDIQEKEIKYLKKEYAVILKKIILTYQDIKSLEKIVEAEASTEQMKGKILVANVVLNRLTQSNKAKSVNDIVLERRQFESVSRGRYYTARPSPETKEAVNKALQKDYSKGALYFMNPEISDRDNVRWFRENLELTVKHKSHSFYK